MKKFFKYLGIFLVLFIAALIIIPYFYKDRIAQYLKDDLNKSLNARVDFDDVSLSLIKSFPYLSVSINNFSINGIEHFEGTRLLHADDFYINLNARKVFWDNDLTVETVQVNKMFLNMVIDSSGAANYDIVKKTEDNDESSGGESTFDLQLKKYLIHDSHIRFEDKQNGMLVEFKGIEHEGKGHITQDSYRLDTETHVESALVDYGAKYLNNARLYVKGPVIIEDNYSKYTLENPDVLVNDLALHFNKSMIWLKEDGIDMDFDFQTEKNSLKEIISLIPDVYKIYLQGMNASGNAEIKGYIKGIYKEDSYPSFKITSRIENGKLQHEKLPESLRDINLIAKVDFPGGKSFDALVIDLPKMKMNVAGSPAEGFLKLNHPISDPYIQTAFKSQLDLNRLKETLELPGIHELTGLLDADFSLNGKISDIENGQYEAFQAKGYCLIDNLKMRSDSLPYPLDISHADMQITPKSLKIKELKTNIGDNDFDIKGEIHNYLSYFLKKDKILKANFNSVSHKLNLNDFMKEETTQTHNEDNPPSNEEALRLPDKVDARLHMKVDQLTYKDMNLKGVNGQVSLNNKRADLSALLMKTLGGNLHLKGYYDSAPKHPISAMKVKMEKLSVAESAETFSVFQTYTPVLKRVNGHFFSDIQMQLKLDEKMNPVMESVDMSGSFNSSDLNIQGINLLQNIASMLKINELTHPQLDKIKARFTIKKGILDVKPFDFKLNNMKASFSGKAGLNQKIDFKLNLDIPKEKLGNKANSVLENLVGKLDKFGLKADLLPSIIKMSFRITGDMNNPKILPVIAGYEGESTGEIIQEIVEDKIEEVVDEKVEEARAKLQAQADKIMAQAKQQANALMQQAQTAAEKIKSEARKQGNSLIDKAGNPFEKLAAKATANELNRQADKKANKLLQKAQNQADNILSKARQQADKILQTDIEVFDKEK